MRAAGGKKNPMDALKAALAERQAKAQKTVAEAGSKWIKRGVLEQQRRDEYLESQRQEEEKQKAAEEAHFQNLSEHFTSRQKPEEQEEERAIPQHILDEALLNDDDAEPPVPLTEVMDRLREMAQPITLFGETDMVRYRRLRNCEKEIYEGKKNPDLVALENVHSGQKMSALHNDVNEQEAEADNDDEEEDAASDDDNNPDAPADDKSDSEDEGEAKPTSDDKSDSEDEGDGEAAKKRVAAMQKAAAEARRQEAAVEGAGKEGEAAAQEAAKLAKEKEKAELPDIDLKLMDRCDFIRAWCRKSLKAWEKELGEKPAESKSTAVVKTELAAHRQCRRDVRPLQKRLRMYVMDGWLLDKIHVIVKAAHDLRYRDANEAYLDLSIGKAAWPVGLGCGGSMLMEDAIGLHDRFNRNGQVKDIAFALNDDVTRKFVQALKRLMSVAQRYWPATDASMAC